MELGRGEDAGSGKLRVRFQGSPDHFPSRFSSILKGMASLTFDTLKFAEKLIAAGVPEAQAKAEASALSEVL